MNKFTIPENYFDNFAEKMDLQIAELATEEKENNSTIIKQKKKNIVLKTFLSSAAAIAVIVVSTFFLQNTNSKYSVSQESIALSNEEYVELMLEQLDPDAIEDIIAEAEYNY